MTSSAGIRELRQHLSRYVDRVKAGETIAVTERGRTVAALVPAVERADALAALAALGVTATPPSLDFDTLAAPPGPSPRGDGPTLAELLAAEREADRRR